MKKILLLLLLSCFIEGQAQTEIKEKPIVTLLSGAEAGKQVEFKIEFHYHSPAYIIFNGNRLVMIPSEDKMGFLVKGKLRDKKIEIYGDAKSIKSIVADNWHSSLNLDSIDISACSELQLLNLATHYNLKKIDLANNTNLLDLTLIRCGLEGDLDVAYLPKLQNLVVFENKLDKIDFPANSLLSVDASANNFKEFDVNKLAKSLEYLDVSKNKIEKLDLSQLQVIKSVWSTDNKLQTFISPENMDSLTDIYLSTNQLTSLDLTEATNIRIVNVHYNQLNHLRLPKSTKLAELNIIYNMLKGDFVLPQCDALERLYCNNNLFTSIDVSAAPNLKIFTFENNRLEKDQLPLLAQTVSLDDIESDYKERLREEAERKRIEKEGGKSYHAMMSRRNPEASLAIDAGYTVMGNRHGTSQGYIGGILGFSTDEKRPYHGRPIHQIFLGAGINYGRYNTHKTESIPTFSVAYMPSTFYLYSRVAMSKYHVHPSVGLNFVNLGQIHVGYSHGYHRKNGIRMSGPTLSFNLNLGINHLFNLSN